MFASLRRLTGVLELVARDRWGHVRQRGFWSIAIPALVAAGLAALFVPLGLVGGSILSGLRGDPHLARILQTVVGAIFVTWVATGILLGARYTLQIDLARLVRLPLGFSAAWGVRAVASLWGAWLVVFAPVLVGSAWTTSAGWADALWRFALVFAFACLTSELTVALRWRYARLSSHHPSLPFALLVGGVVVVPVLILAVRGPAEARHLAEWLAGSRPWPAAPGWLPHVALAKALTTSEMAQLAGSTLSLGVVLALVLLFSHRTFRQAFLVEPLSPAPATRPATVMLGFVGPWFSRVSPAVRIHFAMIAIECISIARISNLRMLLAFGVPYFLVFPMMLPIADFGAFAAVILLALVFLLSSSLKSNVLGLDAATVRQYFIWPVSPASAVRVRLTVLNVAITVLSAEAVAVVAFKGALHSFAEIVVVGGAFASLLFATDVAGGHWSVRSPVAVTWGRAYPVANDAGSLVMAGAILAITLVYVGLLATISRFGLSAAAVTVAVAVPAVIAAWPWRRFRRWSIPVLSGDRERLLAKLRA